MTYKIRGMINATNIVTVIKSRSLRWTGHVARMEEYRSSFKILTGKPTRKRPLGMPRHIPEDNIRMDLREIHVNIRIWIDSAEDRNDCRALVNAALTLPVLYFMELVSS